MEREKIEAIYKGLNNPYNVPFHKLYTSELKSAENVASVLKSRLANVLRDMQAIESIKDKEKRNKIKIYYLFDLDLQKAQNTYENAKKDFYEYMKGEKAVKEKEEKKWQLYECVLRLTGNPKELNMLDAFIKQNNIKVEVVEKCKKVY